MTGPKLFAAATPPKYSPGTYDSKFDESTGAPLRVVTFERISGFRNFKRSKFVL